MKVIVAGGRDFNNMLMARHYLDKLLSNKDVIVEGGARGADFQGLVYALMTGIEMISIPADWNLHGKQAGPLRNIEMSKTGDALIAFWDGQSRGTAHMINTMLRSGKPVTVIYYSYKDIVKPHRSVLNRRASSKGIYIGRGTKYGNPHILTKTADRLMVLAQHMFDLAGDKRRMREVVRELKGKKLVCSCSPLPCHGDAYMWMTDNRARRKELFHA